MLAKLRPLMATAAAKPAPVVAFSTAAAEGDEHAHYNHTDACHHLRWTAKESYEYMYARPWSRVVDFYAELVRTGAGAAGLADLFGKVENGYSLDTNGEDYTVPSENPTSTKSSKDRGGRWERVTFKIVLSYHGGSFDGWQKQPGLDTVQGATSLLREVEKPSLKGDGEQTHKKPLPTELQQAFSRRRDQTRRQPRFPFILDRREQTGWRGGSFPRACSTNISGTSILRFLCMSRQDKTIDGYLLHSVFLAG